MVLHFARSEMQTRYALIDPLLRELGWDTENPALVRPEFRGLDGRQITPCSLTANLP